MTFLQCWDDPASPNNALRIYVSSAVVTKVTLEIPGLGKIVTKQSKPNDVIEFVLPYSGRSAIYKGKRSLSDTSKT